MNEQFIERAKKVGNENNISVRVQNILDRNNEISIKMIDLDFTSLRKFELILKHTLKYYNHESWQSFFSVICQGLIYFLINLCELEACHVKLIKKREYFSIYFICDQLHQKMNKRDFIVFINDLSEDISEQDNFSDLIFAKEMFEAKKIDSHNIKYSSGKIEINFPNENLLFNDSQNRRVSIVNSIENLAPLRDNLIKLNHMIGSNSLPMEKIASQVATDATLSIDILKIVNSGAFHLLKQIDDIYSAVKYLGLKELRNLLITLSVKENLSYKSQGMEQFWIRSYKSAYYSCQIWDAFNLEQSKLSTLYTSALLHDIGQFPINKISQSLLALPGNYRTKFKNKCNLIEDALSGISHEETAYLMAKKWNLPDSLKLVMFFHHSPEAAPQSIKTINDIVYFSDCLLSFENGDFDISLTEKSVLHRYNLNNSGDLLDRFSHLSESFERNNLWN